MVCRLYALILNSVFLIPFPVSPFCASGGSKPPATKCWKPVETGCSLPENYSFESISMGFGFSIARGFEALAAQKHQNELPHKPGSASLRQSESRAGTRYCSSETSVLNPFLTRRSSFVTVTFLHSVLLFSPIPNSQPLTPLFPSLSPQSFFNSVPSFPS